MPKTWTEDELRAFYLKLEPNEVETDEAWWGECLEEVRKVLGAAHDDAAVEILKAAEWGDPSLAVKLRRVAGIPQTEHNCPRCAGSGKVLR